MAYTISYTDKALKYLESLNKKDAVRIYKKIETIKHDPLHYALKLVSIDLWKLRIGDYRAILHLNKGRQTITIIDIGHRKNVYKNL